MTCQQKQREREREKPIQERKREREILLNFLLVIRSCLERFFRRRRLLVRVVPPSYENIHTQSKCYPTPFRKENI